uniref:Uncharacterized protein n=1 Tax=Trichogramma kaykai TaxID=54128 RepID=A0ABD2WTW9_9HYME
MFMWPRHHNTAVHLELGQRKHNEAYLYVCIESPEERLHRRTTWTAAAAANKEAAQSHRYTRYTPTSRTDTHGQTILLMYDVLGEKKNPNCEGISKLTSAACIRGLVEYKSNEKRELCSSADSSSRQQDKSEEVVEPSIFEALQLGRKASSGKRPQLLRGALVLDGKCYKSVTKRLGWRCRQCVSLESPIAAAAAAPASITGSNGVASIENAESSAGASSLSRAISSLCYSGRGVAAAAEAQLSLVSLIRTLHSERRTRRALCIPFFSFSPSDSDSRALSTTTTNYCTIDA